MLNVNEMVLTGAEIKREKTETPRSIEVDIGITKISRLGPTTLRAEFNYSIKYIPPTAKIIITGTALCSDTAENIKEVLAAFKKDKRLPFALGGNLLNEINAYAGLNSIFFVRPFNLLPPFMPPMITGDAKELKK